MDCHKMSKTQLLSLLINQRLTAAANEIFEAVERTMAEYEEMVNKSNLEIDRQRKLLDIMLNPHIHLHREDCKQHYCEEGSPSLVQEDPGPPQMFDVEVWTSRQELQVQGIKEETCSKDAMFTVTCVQDFQEQHYEQDKNPSLVQKDPEPPQRDHNLWTGQGKQKIQEPEEADMFPFTDQRTPAPNGEGCGEPQSPRDFHPQSEIQTEDSDSNKDLMQDSITLASKKTQILCQGPRSADSTKGNSDCSSLAPRKDTTLFCKVCRFPCPSDVYLLKHVEIHATKGSRVCGVCGMFLESPQSLMQHIPNHWKRIVNICDSYFPPSRKRKNVLKLNKKEKGVKVKPGEKDIGKEEHFICGVCGKHVGSNSNYGAHMMIHTEEK